MGGGEEMSGRRGGDEWEEVEMSERRGGDEWEDGRR